MHCNNGLNNKLVESLVENKVAQETGDLKYLQDSMYDFVNTLKEIILGEYSPEFFNKYVDEALKLHGSNLEEFLKIPKMGLELKQALNNIDKAIDTSNQEFRDNLVLLLNKFQTTLDNMEYQARDPYDTAVELGFTGTKQEWLKHLEGDSAYEVAVKNGYKGTQAEWLKYIRADGFIQSIQQFATNNAETKVQIPDYGTINSLQGYIKEMFENSGITDRFKTLVELQTKGAGLKDGSYALVADDTDTKNGIYIKEGGVWVKSKYDPYLRAKSYIDSLQGYDFVGNHITLPRSLLSKNDLVYDRAIGTNGELSSTSGAYYSTDFIKIKPNTSYVAHAKGSKFVLRYAAFYDADKKFTRRVTITPDAGDQHFIVVTSDKEQYCRISCDSGYISKTEDNVAFYEGSEIDVRFDFADRAPKLHDLDISETVNSIVNSNQQLNYVKTAIHPTINLLSPDTVTYGYAVQSNGELAESGASFTSDFVAVSKGLYTILGDRMSAPPITYIAYYDTDKKFIRRVTILRSTHGDGDLDRFLVTIPSDVAYVRLMGNLGRADERNRMFIKDLADVDTPYVTGGLILDNVKLSPSVRRETRKLRFRFDTDVSGTFTSNIKNHPSEIEMSEASAAQVYAKFDALAAEFPDTITVTELGTDAIGNRIACYTFGIDPVADKLHQKYPKMLVNCGIHGAERISPTVMYRIAEQMMHNWRESPFLQALRFNVELLIIPIAVPSSRDASSGNNHNGVNINRNFPIGWSKREASGNTPFSEPETKAIASVIDNNPDLDVVLDYHNFRYTGGGTSYVWVPIPKARYDLMAPAAINFISKVTRLFQKEYSFIPDNWKAGWTEASATSGKIVNYAVHKNVPIAMTLELCETMPLHVKQTGSVKFDEHHSKFMYEATINALFCFLNELQTL